jgi:hypothetical protein
MNLLETMTDRLVLAPASSKYAHHNAYPGGLIDHIFNVENRLGDMIHMYTVSGGKTNIDRRTATFCALFHDIGN